MADVIPRAGNGEALPRLALLWLLGSAALALGLLVYLTDRPAAQLLPLPPMGSLKGHRWFGAVGGWLPSFAHALAFSLFSAALLAARPRWEYGACGCWFAVNAVFEIGQHPLVRGPLAEALQQRLGQGALACALANYFLRGNFDVGDLAAAALGAALAAAILLRLRVRRERCHAA